MVWRHQHQLELAVQHDASGVGGHARAEIRARRLHLLDQRPEGPDGTSNYSAAKAGDIGFVKALAQEGARSGITVNAICPGYIATEMVKAIDPAVVAKNILPHIPVGRLGEPEEIARCVVFLAAEDAGFITGSTIAANGGQYMI